MLPVRRWTTLGALIFGSVPSYALVVIVAGRCVGALGGPEPDQALRGLVVALLVVALSLWCACSLLPVRARHIDARLADEVSRAGGDPRPSLPVTLPSFTEEAEDTSPQRLRLWRDSRRDFMPAPGAVHRSAVSASVAPLVLLLYSAALMPFLTGAAQPGWPRSELLLGLALTTSAVAVLAVDLRRGRIRTLRSPWRAAVAAYPQPWPIQRRATRLWSPPLTVLAAIPIALLIAAQSQADFRFEFAAGAVGVLSALWAIRRPLLTSDGFERLEHACVRLHVHSFMSSASALLWSTSRALVAVGWILAGVLIPIGLAWSAHDPGAEWMLRLGSTVFVLTLGLWFLRRDWQRPDRVLMVSGREIAARLRGTALERRVDITLGAFAVVCAAAAPLPDVIGPASLVHDHGFPRRDLADGDPRSRRPEEDRRRPDAQRHAAGLHQRSRS